MQLRTGPRLTRRRPSAFSVVMCVAAGLFLLLLSVPNMGPAIRAAGPDGAPGTFTAAEVVCVKHMSHESCAWQGSFRADDGRTTRDGIGLYGSSRNSLRLGQTAPAVDVGRASRVYPPSGSREWIPTAVLMAAGAMLLAWPALTWLRRRRPPGRR